MITPEVRFSYVNVFEPRKTPSGDMKYSVALWLPKEDKEGLILINNAVQAAIDAGLAKNKIAKAHIPNLRPTIRDGDKELDSEGNPRAKGYWFINCNSNNAPGIIDAQLKPLTSTDEFYSGCWGRADVNFYAYNQAVNKGVGCGLNNLMKTRDDDRLDGRLKATDVFAQYAQEAQNADNVAAADPQSTNPFK